MSERRVSRRSGRLGRAMRRVALIAALAATPPPIAPAAAWEAGSPGGREPSAVAAAARVHAEVERRARLVDARLRARIAREILAEAARAGVDPLLVVAMIHVESSFDPGAVSSHGAAGLMQLRDSTMRDVAVRSGVVSANPLDPVANIQAGVRYLAALIGEFEDEDLALMAYNAGPGRIRGYLREGAVPERFWKYPRTIAREMLRLGGSRAARAGEEEPLAVNVLEGPRR